MNEIFWPEGYLPGTTENFASNEAIVAGLDAARAWPWLVRPHRWPDYYRNAADVRLHDGPGPAMAPGTRFHFRTFGFAVEARVVECRPPSGDGPARLAWHGRCGEGADRLDVHHAWLLEDLPGGRLRILTQETQKGRPAAALAATRPDPMINGHQEWLDGLVRAARAAG